MAKITTAIPVFNGARFIASTLRSLADQTVKPDRVVVLDDCSTDKTEEIVRGFKDLQIDWAPNSRNQGLFPNHNVALRLAEETEFLHILHADDIILPSFFETLVPLLAKCEGRGLAFGGHVFVREDSSEMHQSKRFASKVRQISLREFLLSLSELKAIQLHSAVMKTNFRPLPIQFRTDLPQVADIVFHAELAALCSEIWASPDVLCHVRMHRNNASNKNMFNLDAWVTDEWRAMQEVYSIMEKQRVGGWLRQQKLKLLFAARSHVKVKTVKNHDAAYAQKIAALARGKSGALYWAAARAVVALRDGLAPAKDTAAERAKLRNEN